MKQFRLILGLIRTLLVTAFNLCLIASTSMSVHFLVCSRFVSHGLVLYCVLLYVFICNTGHICERLSMPSLSK